MRRRGLLIIDQPHAILSHFESASKDGIFQEEIDRFVARWGNEFACDPYDNPNLTKVQGDYRLGAGIEREFFFQPTLPQGGRRRIRFSFQEKWKDEDLSDKTSIDPSDALGFVERLMGDGCKTEF